MSNLIHFTSDSFKEALSKDGVMVVDFWATWCGPCRMIAPAIEQLADEYAGKAVIGKVDIDACMDLATEYDVMSIPNVIIFKDGQILDRKIGAMPKQSYADAIEDALV